VNGSPFQAGTYPEGIAFDPNGKFAYVANDGSNTVSGFAVDGSSGVMSALPGSPFQAGSGPYGIAACRVRNGVCRPAPL
jgi:DNA-binding beta-propeller fold protein YncE